MHKIIVPSWVMSAFIASLTSTVICLYISTNVWSNSICTPRHGHDKVVPLGLRLNPNNGEDNHHTTNNGSSGGGGSSSSSNDNSGDGEASGKGQVVAPRQRQQQQQWRQERQGEEQPAYSVIVVAKRPHPSNLFRVEERVRTYSPFYIASIQFANPEPSIAYGMGREGSQGQGRDDEELPPQPFFVGHLEGVDRRVRIVHTVEFVAENVISKNQASHLKAACEDTSERTLLLVTDETCERIHLPWRMPAACWGNVARHYPYNAPSPDVETRNAYVPLGPRDTFPFVEASRRHLASSRGMFFNLEVSKGTSPRRDFLIALATEYAERFEGTTQAHLEGPHMNNEEYQELLLGSKFTLCPGGHNPETFRMFEALEAGSIPIVSRQDYFEPAWKEPYPCGKGSASWNTVAGSPFAQEVSVNSWIELPELLDRLQHEPDEYIDKLQADSIAWYEALMRRTYESVLNFGVGLELWPQDGPIELPGFPAPANPQGFVSRAATYGNASSDDQARRRE